MKARHYSIILSFLGVILIIFGTFKLLNNTNNSNNIKEKNNEQKYLKATGNIKGLASFKEKNNKLYIQVNYENTSTKTVKLEKVKLVISKSENNQKYYEKEMNINKILLAQQKGTIKFVDIPGTIETMKEYYAEAIFE